MSPLSACVFLLAFVHGVHGSCFIGPMVNKTGALGTVRETCFLHDLNMTIAVGGTVKSYDSCFTYQCRAGGLDACGFGAFAGIIVVQGCKTLNKACLPYFVQDPSSPYQCAETLTKAVSIPDNHLTKESSEHRQNRPSSLPVHRLCDDQTLSDEAREYICNPKAGVAPIRVAFTAVFAYTCTQLAYFFV